MCILFPFILFYRCIVAVCCCCFKQRDRPVENIEQCLDELKSSTGGWFRDSRRTHVSIRDTFYIFMVQHACDELDTDHVFALLQHMSQNMTNEGQVPWCFTRHWFGDEMAVYKNLNKTVVDANMQFIIMVWWLYHRDYEKVRSLYLHCRRAWQWLDIQVANDTVYEPVGGGSWEDSRQHKGVLLLTNVMYIHTIRSMELLHTAEHEERKVVQFRKRHERAVSTWMPEIYKTQETLPRILAVHFGIVPESFVKSFNQEIQSAWIPCRVAGPVPNIPTYEAWVCGYPDKHDTLIWPWIGFLWIIVLHRKKEHELANAWWTSYLNFHKPKNLYDIYSPDSCKPVRRAFLKGHANHALTIATWCAAKYMTMEDLI